MNLFQLIAVPLLGLLFLRSVLVFLRGRGSRRVALASAVIWLAGGVFIIKPEWTMRVAELLGIGRGADLVLYGVAILFFASIFYYHERLRNLDAQLTRIVRDLAITNAKHGSELLDDTNPEDPKD